MNVKFNHSKTLAQAKALSDQNDGTIYFPTNSSLIVHGGKEYGVSNEDRAAISAILQAITNNNGQLGANTLPYVLETEAEYDTHQPLQNIFYFLYEDSWGFGDNFPVTLE